MKNESYLDKEEVDPEGGRAPGQLDVLVLGVNLRCAHQAPVLGEDLLLHVPNFHEAQREKLFQAARTETQLIKALVRWNFTCINY